MIIHLILSDSNGNPVNGATITHVPGCCQYRAVIQKMPGGVYQVTIPTETRRSHKVRITAPGYQSQTVKVDPPLMLIHKHTERYITLEADPAPEDHTDPGIGSSSWKMGIEGTGVAAPCAAIAVSTKKPCKRRTTGEFCFQHRHTITPEMKKYAGKWNMSGRQVNVERSGWEAELLLRADGTVSWKETKGANPGATRKGCWTLQDRSIQIRYLAPVVGRVEWQADNIYATSMQGTYKTSEAGPAGYGWGGEWSASKATAIE